MTQLVFFTEPVGVQKFPTEPILRDATFDSRGHRYELKRAWGAGPAIAWIGLNPSIADTKVDDPTIRREIGFSFRWGYGSLIKLNLFPFVSPDPREMRKWADGLSQSEETSILGDNVLYAAEAIASCDLAVAAWGNGALPAEVQGWCEAVRLSLSARADPKPLELHCLGTNDDGSPRHTLSRGRNRIPDEATPFLWRTFS